MSKEAFNSIMTGLNEALEYARGDKTIGRSRIREAPAKITPRRHITLAERLKDWDGQPYELTDEDREWLNMKPVGKEI